MNRTKTPETAAQPESLPPYQRVLAEGPLPFNEAFRAAGVPMPGYDAVWRLKTTGKLDTVRIAGKTYTSEAAVRRMVAAANSTDRPAREPRTRRGRGRREKPATSAAAKAFLRARGLPTGEEGA